MIPLAIPNVGPREAAYLQQCIEENQISSVGPFVQRFEALVAGSCGAAHAVATTSGTTALHLGLVTLGVQRDDLVIAPAFSFIASANAIVHAGAIPWFLDIDATSWTLRPEALAQALGQGTRRDADGILRHRDSGRRVAAIMPVYTLGIVPDMTAIRAIAMAHRLPVLADAAAAIGAVYNAAPLADLADLSAFSFNGNKTITCGGGGMLVGNDRTLLDLARHLSTTARVGRDYHHDQVGFNYRLTNLQAAVGCAQMERLQDFVAAKRRIKARYDAAWSTRAGLGIFPDPEWGRSSCWFSGLVADPGHHDAGRLIQDLGDRGIGARPFWKPLHLQPAHQSAIKGSLPITEQVWQRVVTLPCSTSLTEIEQDQVIAAVFEIIEGKP